MVIHFPENIGILIGSVLILKLKISRQSFFDNKDNCLLTIELVKLKEWLSYLKNINFDEADEILFMEPILSIKFKNNQLEIVLRYKLNPKYIEDFDSEYSLFFSVNQKEILNIIAQLERYIKKYPEKQI